MTTAQKIDVRITPGISDEPDDAVIRHIGKDPEQSEREFSSLVRRQLELLGEDEDGRIRTVLGFLDRVPAPAA